MQEKLGIPVGGGPAPGINSVIGAATLRAREQGIEVLGIRDRFEWIMQGDIATCRLSREEFRAEFEYLVEDEPPALVLEGFAGADAVEPAASPKPRAHPTRRPRRAR
jgi:hypothetical protein